MSWAEIKKAINSNISKSLDILITEKSNEVKTVANSNNSLLNNSTYGLSALQSIISNIKSLLENTTYGLNAIKTTVNSVNNTVSVVGNIPSVKSVQRGNVSDNYSENVTINISSVNVNKSIVILNGGMTSNYFSPVVLVTLTSTNFSVSNAYEFSWQVIEFY